MQEELTFSEEAEDKETLERPQHNGKHCDHIYILKK
jgi:hypothetical protein